MSKFIEKFYGFRAYFMEHGMDIIKVTVSPLFEANFEREILEQLRTTMQSFFEAYCDMEYEVDYKDNGISIRYEISDPFGGK